MSEFNILNESEQAKVLRRVKKLLTLGNDPAAAEGERDNALRMAHATLAKYNLSMAQAEAEGSAPEEKRLHDGELVTPDYPWMRTAAMAVAELFFCRYFFSRVRGKSGKSSHTFIGKESNVITAKGMAGYVWESINREARRYIATHGLPGGGAEWRAFANGAAARIQERCREILAATQQQQSTPSGATGTALVLASVYDAECEANKRYLSDTLGIRLRSSRGMQAGRGTAALAAGRKFGDSVQLNRQVSDGRKGNLRLN